MFIYTTLLNFVYKVYIPSLPTKHVSTCYTVTQINEISNPYLDLPYKPTLFSVLLKFLEIHNYPNIKSNDIIVRNESINKYGNGDNHWVDHPEYKSWWWENNKYILKELNIPEPNL